MSIQKNKSLKPLNTFGIEVKASEFVEVYSEDELIKLLKKVNTKALFILSGGSNMLLTKDIDALVIHNKIKGIHSEILPEENKVLLSVGSGENWHDFVQYCIDNDYGGIENLSLIPGYVGSAPIQNIGAYGVELKDTFYNCDAIEIKSAKKVTFSKEDCDFGYRDSIFKNEAKNKYIITQVRFILSTANHKLNIQYGAIESELDNKGIINPTIKDISEAVITIRKSKLPDPREIGNSGSFFKNPVIEASHFNKLKEKYPDIPSYNIDKKNIKVPAGWLIEKSGFKGKRWGDAGVHNRQALVLVNYGNASGKEIQELSERIKKTVKREFDIELETEVNIF